MIPQRFAPILFSLILSGLMSLLVSGIALFRMAGLSEDAMNHWLSAWLAAWPVAFPTVLLVAPLTQKIVRLLVAKSN